MEPLDNPIALDEQMRVYHYAGGQYTLLGVTELIVRPSGSHRLKTADGRLHILSPGWLAITVTDEKGEWTA